MEILYFMLPFALLITILFVIAFIYSVSNGQYEDLETPAHRILLNDNKIEMEEELHE